MKTTDNSAYDWRPQAALTFLAVPLGLRAERLYRSLPRLGRTPIPAALPALSIIVPARNEAHNLAQLLPSLRALRYPGPLEVIVVDDASSDQTAQVAAFLGARVISTQGPAPGWKGKPHACHLGARAARGEWLLFTDADTVHAPESAAQAVSFALQARVDGVSLFLKQKSKGPLDRLALTTAFAGLFAGFRPAHPILNGQYILLRSTAYHQSGGFAAVRNEALEDVALGVHLRTLGYTVPMVIGEEAAVVRMYDSVSQLWHGMNRLGAESLRWSGRQSLWTALLVVALMSPIVTLLAVLRGGLDRKWLPATWVAAALPMVPWSRRFGSPLWAALAPVGALFVQLAAVWGLVNRLVGRGVHWKGRRV